MQTSVRIDFERISASRGTRDVIHERLGPAIGAMTNLDDILPKVQKNYDVIVQQGMAGWVLQK